MTTTKEFKAIVAAAKRLAKEHRSNPAANLRAVQRGRYVYLLLFDNSYWYVRMLYNMGGDGTYDIASGLRIGNISEADVENADTIDAMLNKYSGHADRLLQVNTADLKAISQFRGNDVLRPLMTAVCVQGDDIVATDAHRLMWIEKSKGYPWGVYENTFPSDVLLAPVTVDFMTCAEWTQLRSHDVGDGTTQEFVVGEYWAASLSNVRPYLDGKYINWRVVLPEDLHVCEWCKYEPVIKFLEDAIKLSKSVGGYPGRVVLTEDTIKFEMTDVEVDPITMPVNLSSVGEISGGSIGLKPPFLLEYLKVAKAQKCGCFGFDVSAPNRPMRFRFGHLQGILTPLFITN